MLRFKIAVDRGNITLRENRSKGTKKASNTLSPKETLNITLLMRFEGQLVAYCHLEVV